MPDPTRLLHTLRQAIRKFHETPGRRGSVVHLADATDVLAAGDLHGNLENFRRLLGRAELGTHPGRHLVLQELVHGPNRYPAGGDKSHQLLDLVAALKCQYPRQVHFLIGNHELAQWTGQWIAKGDADFNELFRVGVASAYGAASEEIYAAYLELFAAASLAVRTPNRVFLSHSLPSAKRLETFDNAALEREATDLQALLPGSAVHALVWGRDTTAATAAAFLQKVDADLLITGHIPCAQGFAAPNDRQLILDCMAAPACCCLFPADRPLTHQELLNCVATL
ncbi:MAG TPA: metallophosphoesterase [Gemmataceae bacterium]|nr:metallophosphoesterase [Gemmataceae bacterium]